MDPFFFLVPDGASSPQASDSNVDVWSGPIITITTITTTRKTATWMCD